MKKKTKTTTDGADEPMSPDEEKKLWAYFRDMIARNRIAMNRRCLRVNPYRRPMTVRELHIVEAFDPTAEISFPSLGEDFAYLLRETSSDQLEEVFSRIVKAKREFENLPHRNFYAYEAYLSFKEQVGRDPTMCEHEDFIMARRDIYKDAPAADDKTGWNRLRKISGLSHLKRGRRISK